MDNKCIFFMKNNTTYKLMRLLNEMYILYLTVNCNYIHIVENRFKYIYYLYVLEFELVLVLLG